jgi:RNA polymerase sigma factor (sigma-70 family)
MLDQVFDNFRKASESTLQMQQEMFKQWVTQWPAMPTSAAASPRGAWAEQAQTIQTIGSGETHAIYDPEIPEWSLIHRSCRKALRCAARHANAARQLYQELGREPTPESIGERLGMTADRVSELLIWAEKVFSLDAPLSEEEENTLGDIIEDVRERGPVEVTDHELLREEIRKALGQLTTRERQVIELRFGLADDHDHTLEEVGKKLKVTRERVRQIEERAIRKLRHPQASRILKDYLE